MNLLEKLMSIINKQKQAILFSQKDKEIIREISQCNNSYYKTKVLAVLQCELSDWSYDISKYMIKDKNRLIAEKSISVIQEFKRLEDFLNLFEQYQKDEFINYELIEAIGYIGIMRQLDDDIIEKRMKEILQNLEKNRTNMMEEQFFIFGSYVESIYGNSEINRYQQWLENNGSEKNKALILYLRAVWEVAKDEYDLFNETALKYARESLECDKDIPAVYHIIGRLTSPDTSEYEKIKKDLKKHVVYISLQEIEEMSLNKLYSYDTFLKMDILKKIIKPNNFSLILLEEVSDNFWNWEL